MRTKLRSLAVGFWIFSVVVVCGSHSFAQANDWEQAMKQGSAAKDRNDPDLAISYYTEAIRLNPKLSGIPYQGIGVAYLMKREPDRAIMNFNEAIRLTETLRRSPKDNQVNHLLAPQYAYRGIAYCAKSNFDQAVTDCSEAIRLDPQNANLRTMRDIVYKAKKDQNDAAAAFNTGWWIGTMLGAMASGN